MTEKIALHTVAIYLKGDGLMPEMITNILGIDPTDSHIRGEKAISSSGKEIVKRTGLWKLSIEAKSSVNLPPMLGDVATKLLASGHALAGLPGVEEAFIDIFIAQMKGDAGATSEFLLDKPSLELLNRIALPVQFTVTIIDDKDNSLGE